MTYHFEIIGPDILSVHENVEDAYPLTKTEIEEAIERVKANRRKYASDVAYQRRLQFFEEALKEFEPKPNSNHDNKI
jgi:hypothetical protein